MGNVWLRTKDDALVRADRIHTVSCLMGSVRAEIGPEEYAVLAHLPRHLRPSKESLPGLALAITQAERSGRTCVTSADPQPEATDRSHSPAIADYVVTWTTSHLDEPGEIGTSGA